MKIKNNQSESTFKFIIILIIIIISFQILFSIFIGNFINKKSKIEQQLQITNSFNIYIEGIKEKTNNFIDGFSHWDEIMQGIHKNDNNYYTSDEIKNSWLSGNGDKNDITAIIINKQTIVSGGLMLDKLGNIFNDTRLENIYNEVSMNKFKDYTIIYGDDILFLSASPICDNYGKPGMEGIEIFAVVLKDSNIVTIEKLTNSKLSQKNKNTFEINIYDSFDKNKYKSFFFLPNVSTEDLVFKPVILNIIIQIIVFFIIVFSLYIIFKNINKITTNLNKNLILINKSKSEIEKIKNLYNSTFNFFDKFKINITTTEQFINEIKTNLNNILNTANNELNKISMLSTLLTEASDNILTIINNINNGLTNIENSNNLILDLNNNSINIKKLCEESNKIADELVNVTEKSRDLIKKDILILDEANKSSKDIMDFLNVISNISQKTNMLSINASIEASHAGEFGKGFSIVAEEIRTLSENTQKSAKNIESVINEIYNKINISVKEISLLESNISKVNDHTKENLNLTTNINISFGKQLEDFTEIKNSVGNIYNTSSNLNEIISNQKQLLNNITDNLLNVQNFSNLIINDLSIHMKNIDSLLLSINGIKNLDNEGKILLDQFNEIISKIDEIIIEAK